MTTKEQALQWLQEMKDIQAEMDRLNQQELTEEILNEKFACLNKLIALYGTVGKAKAELDEQKRKAGERGDPDNQREGEQYDTPNQEWTET